MSGRRPIGPVDTIWLNMDRPNNLMAVDMLMMFETPVDWDRLVGIVQTRLVDVFPVFRQRPVGPHTPIGTPHWEDDPDFDLDRHLKRVVLESPGDQPALQRYVEEQLHVPFTRNHPLWEFHLVEGFGSGAAVFGRIHHSLADGIALMGVFLSLTDDGPDAEPRGQETAYHTQSGGLVGDAVRATAGLAAAVRDLAYNVRQLVWDLPRRVRPRSVVDAFTLARKTGGIANKLVLGHNPETPFGGEPGVRKLVVWSDPVPLDDLKQVGRLCGATLNDVLMSALAGAVGSYLADHGTPRVDLSTMVPVNVRPLDRPLPPELGNEFALVLCPLASSMPAPLERLAETKRRMDAIKDSPEAVLTFGLISAIGRSGAELERFLVDFFAGKAIGVTTNVAGPKTPRYLAGTRVASILGWVPGSGSQTLGVCIVTYCGSVRVGFKADADQVPDPDKLIHAFENELDDLVRLAHAL